MRRPEVSASRVVVLASVYQIGHKVTILDNARAVRAHYDLCTYFCHFHVSWTSPCVLNTSLYFFTLLYTYKRPYERFRLVSCI